MHRDYIDFQERTSPVGFLITIRCYGTWLHGDPRGSVNRRSFNRFGEPKIEANEELRQSDKKLLTDPPFHFHTVIREHVDAAVREVCRVRNIGLYAINVRSNHAHAVTGPGRHPDKLMTDFKAYSTRRLRESGLVSGDARIWSRHGSTKYLWTEDQINAAVDYVLYGQGDGLGR